MPHFLSLSLSVALWLVAGLARADTAAVTPAPLAAMGALASGLSVSGISSGGYMAAQFHVAYSSRVEGAAIVAGGPYYCAASSALMPNVLNAQTLCMDPCAMGLRYFYGWGCEGRVPDGPGLFEKARAFAEDGLIDAVDNLSNDRIYVFSSAADTTVKRSVVDQLPAFYRAAGVKTDNLLYAKHERAAHAFITNDPTDNSCTTQGEPFINNCEYDQARALLSHLYGDLAANSDAPDGQIVAFDQRPFVDATRFERSSMADTGYLYVPNDCRKQGCRVHVVFHGCRQAAAEYADRSLYFYEEAGYNRVAEHNRLMILYPQLRDRQKTRVSPMNPRGCWDFWGYSGDDFYLREGVQMQAVSAMVDRLISNVDMDTMTVLAK